ARGPLSSLVLGVLTGARTGPTGRAGGGKQQGEREQLPRGDLLPWTGGETGAWVRGGADRAGEDSTDCPPDTGDSPPAGWCVGHHCRFLPRRSARTDVPRRPTNVPGLSF